MSRPAYSDGTMINANTTSLPKTPRDRRVSSELDRVGSSGMRITFPARGRGSGR